MSNIKSGLVTNLPAKTTGRNHGGLMYINKQFSTSTHHQVPLPSPGVTAAELQASTQTILLFSVYILLVDKVVAIDEERLRRITQAMRDTIEAHKRDRDTGPGHGTGHNNGEMTSTDNTRYGEATWN
jgi:hypothetical protein